MKKTLFCLLSVLLTLCLFVSCMFDVGNRSTYKRIEVSKKPNRDVFVYYNDGSFTQQFDFTGLEVRGFKNDSDTEGVDITKYCYVYSPRLSSGTLVTESLKGTHELTVYYTQGGETLTTTFEIKVIDGGDYTMKGGYVSMRIGFKIEWFEGFVDIRSTQVTEIEFVKQTPESFEEGKTQGTDYTTSCDLTKNGNENIMGYLTESKMVDTDNDGDTDSQGYKIWIVGECIVGNENCKGMFLEFINLEIIKNFHLFDTSKVTNMESLFMNCTILEKLDLSSFDTSNVTTMANMFSGCSGLTELDLSSFNTSNVTKMTNMFNSCEGLTTLNLSNFDTSKVANMYQMFYGCDGLTSLDLSSFDVSKVSDSSNMFQDCGHSNGQPKTEGGSYSESTTVTINSTYKTFFDGVLGSEDWSYTSPTYTRKSPV